jgi:hypothetical protein
MLNREWVVAFAGGDGRPKIYRCNFTETLLVKITDILLYGRLRFDFVKFGRVHSVAIRFNTVSSELYHNAVQLMLAGMVSQRHAVLENNGKAFEAPPDLPLKFQNAMVRHLPVGQQVLEFVYWPPGFGRLLPYLWREYASLLALTDTHLLSFSEGEFLADGRSQGHAKYGYTVTYCPHVSVPRHRSGKGSDVLRRPLARRPAFSVPVDPFLIRIFVGHPQLLILAEAPDRSPVGHQTDAHAGERGYAEPSLAGGSGFFRQPLAPNPNHSGLGPAMEYVICRPRPERHLKPVWCSGKIDDVFRRAFPFLVIPISPTRRVIQLAGAD